MRGGMHRYLLESVCLLEGVTAGGLLKCSFFYRFLDTRERKHSTRERALEGKGIILENIEFSMYVFESNDWGIHTS